MTKPDARPSGDSVPLGARIRARSPQKVANNPWTVRDRTGLRAGYAPATSPAADSAARLEQVKITGDQSGALSYEDAKAALGW